MQKVVLVHFGRSGSTVLAKMIETAPNVVWLHETYSLIWQGMADKSQYDFDCAGMIDIARKEVERRAQPSTELIGLEVKLINMIHSGNCSMQDYIRGMVADGDWQVVTLTRRNALARILSIYRAAATGVWHMKSRTESEKTTYRLPLSKLHDPDTGVRGDNLVDFLRDVQMLEKNMMTNVRNECDVVLDLVYEDHISKDPSVACALLGERFGLSPFKSDVPLARTGTNTRKELENVDEVGEVLHGTNFEWMLEDILN